MDLRNWLAHGYFWERSHDVLTWEGRERMIAELEDAAVFLKTLAEELTAIELKWLERPGVDRNALHAELDEFLRRG